MKKVALMLLLTMTLFMPPVCLHLAFSAAERNELEEARERLFSRAVAELNQIAHLTNEPYVLNREVNRLKVHIESNTPNLHQGIVNGSIEKMLNEQVPMLLRRFAFPVQIDCFMLSASNNSVYKMISYGHNLGLSAITMQIASFQGQTSPVSADLFAIPGRYVDHTLPHNFRTRQIQASTQQLNHLLYNCYDMLALEGIERLTLRDQDLHLFLFSANAQSQLIIFVLAEARDLTVHNAFRSRIASAEHHDFGLGAVLDSQSAPLFSVYFKQQPELRKKLEKLLKSIDNEPLLLETAEHRILINAYNQSIRGRSFIAMPLSQIERSEKLPQKILIALMFMLSCLAFRILIEKIVLGRGPDVSIRLLLPATFLILVIQPIFVATYLSVDFFRSSYANEKSRASARLASDMRNIDMTTLDGFRETLNLARSFSTIEKIASFTGISYRENEQELCFALLKQISREKSADLYSSVSFSAINRPFAGARFNPNERRYEHIGAVNPLFSYFHNRYQEILREASGKSVAVEHKNQKSLDREIKNEFSRDFFLQILGPESFYRFRQDSNILLSFNTKFKEETAITVPVSYHNRPFAFATWHIGDSGDNASSSFPLESLSLTGNSPRIAFRGSDRLINGHHFLNEQIAAAQPELFRIGHIAHQTRGRVTSRIEHQENTIISEAISGNYSNFTIAGSEILKSYQSFCRDLAVSNLTNLAVIVIMGLTLAFIGALYFVTPLRELTHAAYQIARGDFSCRISVNHPDDFSRIGEAFNRMATGLDESQRLKNFVSDSVRREIASTDETEIVDRACSRHATIIFSAICSFSDFQKSHQAGEVFGLLQQHLQAADHAIKKFGGEIDKMIEDKIMIVFEHDEPGSEMSERAIKLAEAIATAMQSETGRAVGIGINTGMTVAGVMGAANARLARTVVGDPVNLAARLASLATQRPAGGIIASQQILEGLPLSFTAEKLPINKVKGKTQTVEAYLLEKLNS